MREIKRRYIKMLGVELEDLKDDIDLLVDEYIRLHDSEQLTNYVFYENLTVIRKELLGVNAFRRVLNETDPDRFDTLDALINHLSLTFRNMVRESGLPK